MAAIQVLLVKAASTVVADEVAVFGCEDGALNYPDGSFTKIDEPAAFSSIGRTKGHDASSVAVCDLYLDAEADSFVPNIPP